jgi:hypothetical protein
MENDAGAGSGTGAESESDEPVEIGDGREKHVTVVTRAGERIEHGDVYLRHSETAFVVSPEPEFPAGATTRYRKATLGRVEITQHHSACFITTATAGATELDALRAFRDEAFARSTPGRALVACYKAVSPPIAATLARHPEARTTCLVRQLVERCAGLARRRAATPSPLVRAGLSLALTALYVLGVCAAALGHLSIRLRELRRGRRSP